jgi:hypothetical protein
MKDKLRTISDEALMNKLQQAITAVGTEKVKIRRVQKIPNHGIKIRCATEKEAEELHSMDWKKVLEGANVVETPHRIVFHGVSKFDVDFEKDKPEEIVA